VLGNAPVFKRQTGRQAAYKFPLIPNIKPPSPSFFLSPISQVFSLSCSLANTWMKWARLCSRWVGGGSCIG